MNKRIESIIGIVGLGGSYLGLTMSVPYLFKSQGVFSFIIALLFGGLYLFGTYAGYTLLTAKTKSSYRLNFYFWLIQVVALYSPGITYFFGVGAFLVVGFDLAKFKFDFGFQFGSKYAFYVFNVQQSFIVYINFVAVFFSWFLYRALNLETSVESPKSAQPLGAPSKS